MTKTPSMMQSLGKRLTAPMSGLGGTLHALRRRYGLQHKDAELTLPDARKQLRSLGLKITRMASGGYRVSRKGVAAVAYESDDLQDAVQSARRLAEQEPEYAQDDEDFEDNQEEEDLEVDELPA